MKNPPYRSAVALGLTLALSMVACAPSAAAPTVPAVSTLAPTLTTASATQVEPTLAATVVTTAVSTTPEATAEAIATKLDLNTASDDEFLTVPGVGNRMLREFKEYRPYTTILQFRREIGKYVDEAQVAAYEQYVFVPVDVNAADAATLMQLPGVDETIANALIAARPFADHDAFLTALSTHVSADQLAAASAYLVTP